MFLRDPRLEHARRHDLAGLGLVRPHDFVGGHGVHPDVQVDAVEDRARQLGQVVLSLDGRAGAAVALAVVAAGAGIGGGDEHERGGELDLRLEAGDADGAVFDRPPEGLDDRFGHLPDFVEKEDAAVRERHLAREDGLSAAPAHDGRERRGIVRGAEGAPADQPVLRAALAGHRIDFARDERLFHRHRRQDARQGLGERALAGPRGTDHDDVVSAGGGDLDAALGALLADDVREVHPGEGARRRHPRSVHLAVARRVPDQQVVAVFAPLQDAHDRIQPVHAIDLHVLEFSGLQGRIDGQDDALEARLPGHLGDGERARDRADAPVQPELAHQDEMARARQLALRGGGDDADGDRQVVAAAVLAQVRGREVDDDPFAGNLESQGLQGRGRAQEALLDGRVGQPDQVDPDPPVDVDLDRHFDGVDPDAFRTVNVCQHSCII